MSATPESSGQWSLWAAGNQHGERQAGVASRAALEEQQAAESLMRGHSEAETEGKKIHQRLKSNKAELQNKARKAARRQRSGGLEY